MYIVATGHVPKQQIDKEIGLTNNPVVWFEIYVEVMDRAKKFDEAVFAVSLEQLNDPNASGIEMWSFPTDMEKYGTTGTRVKMDDISAGSNSTLIYFSCEDGAIEESRVESAAGSLQQTKMAIGEHGFVSLAVDTEGNDVWPSFHEVSLTYIPEHYHEHPTHNLPLPL